MLEPQEIQRRIVTTLIERLELEDDYTEDSFPCEALLFADSEHGGLEFDSIASLEIAAGLADEFDLELDDIKREDFLTILTLTAYVTRSLEAAGED